MNRNRTPNDDDLLDAEAWDVPARLSDHDLHAHDLNSHGGPGWRRAGALDDLEDYR